MSNKIQKALINFCRLLTAVVLIFSGYVKAVDPLGTQYKLTDYATALSVNDIVPPNILNAAAILLAAFEFTIGILLLFAIQRRIVSRLALLFMALMTILTIWIWLFDPVSDCGCFGDAVRLTNGQTLIKNVILLACTLILAWKPLLMKRFIGKRHQWIIINYTILFILATSAWCLWDLPIFDFRPYHVGANIAEGMAIPEGAEQPQYETTFIMEKDGHRQEFSVEEYPDSTWHFIDRKNRLVKGGYVPPIHDFSIQTTNGEDITNEVINQKGYVFLLVSPHLEEASDVHHGEINEIYEYAKKYECQFICLTASGKNAIKRWCITTEAEYPFMSTDETTLKTIIRSNPGLLLLKDGTIIQKWSHNNLPDSDALSVAPTEAAFGKISQNSVALRILFSVAWYVLPLLLLLMIDKLFTRPGNVKDKK